MEDIRTKLRQGLIDGDHDDEDDDDVIAYPQGMSRHDRDAYKKTIHASKHSEWRR